MCFSFFLIVYFYLVLWKADFVVLYTAAVVYIGVRSARSCFKYISDSTDPKRLLIHGRHAGTNILLQVDYSF